MSNDLHTLFPEQYGWVTSRDHYYQPITSSAEAQRSIAAMLIKRDKDLARLIRERCVKRWAIAVKVGATTAHLRVFDPATADPQSSPYNGCEGMVYLWTNRRHVVTDPTPQDLIDLSHCRPILYADRRLTPVERQEFSEICELIYPTQPPLMVATA